MSEFKKDESEIGALWAKQGPKGEYFTGTINGVAVVVFHNTKKAPGSKQPDLRVLKSRPKDESLAQSFAKAGALADPIDSSDIPF